MKKGDRDADQTEGCGNVGEVHRYLVHPVRGRGGRAVGWSGNI